MMTRQEKLITPEQIAVKLAENKKLQGERKTAKKKINRFNNEECMEEIHRLKRGNHQQSKYYKQVQKKSRKFSFSISK